jgi:type IV secretory pathway TraG/TraD family ATPase VirD4
MLTALRIAWESLRLSVKAAMGLAYAVTDAIERHRVRRGAHAARHGQIGPDDPPPPPEAATRALDYRGLARPRELALEPWAYRLGRLREPGRRWELLPGGEIGLAPTDIEGHVAILGPARSGRTSSFVVPWIYGALGCGRSVLAVDARGDLWAALRRYGAQRERLNANVYHWSYRDPGRSSSWRWIDELSSAEAIEAAVEAILGRERPTDPAPAQRRHDARMLTALLALARTQPRTSAAEMLTTISDRQRLQAFLSPLPASGFVRDLGELLTLQGSQYRDAVSGVVDGLRPLASPEVLRVSEAPGLTLELLDRAPSLLIAGLPAGGGRTAETTVGLLLALAVERRLRGSASRTPMLLILDEAPRIQERIQIQTLLSLGAAAGLAVVLTAQGVGQFSESEREEIMSNCETMILLPRVGKSSTAYFSERLGNRTTAGLLRSTRRERPWDPPQRGLDTSNQTVPMLGHREISMPPFGGYPAIVHARALHGQPFLVDVARDDV